ncbi:ribosylnicotinamide kinase [Coniosporium apollinis]|uniref:Ribosylnicotinamide kinase n=1 Tax=Coniosporium apollinis TaxID=61459 RepID=A0ABQ9NPK5_9PEZI|nr:ribosylnicotinamide kinase [Coniosporium apollinis]
MSPPSTLLLGLSGPSSSGKTTLARLLRDILNSAPASSSSPSSSSPPSPTSPPPAFILHLDDFYKTDSEIPLTPMGLPDWDCLESLDLPRFLSALKYIKTHGAPPPDLVSIQDGNAVGPSGVDDAVVERLKAELGEGGGMAKLGQVLREGGMRVCIIDGFLLFSEEMQKEGVREMFDLRLFLRAPYAVAKKRREERQGYVTLEGFWADPPGYVDDVVWPNYVKDHGFLFRGGNVDGEFDAEVLERCGIRGMPAEAEGDMTKCLEWAWRIVGEEIGKRTAG